MVERGRLPSFVAARFDAMFTAMAPTERALAAFDVADAVIRYVALVRLAAWWRQPPAASAEHHEVARMLRPALWGVAGARPLAWWRVERALAAIVPEVPPAPGLADLTQARFEQLDRVRRSRHGNLRVDVTPDDMARAVATAQALVAAAAPVLALPLVIVPLPIEVPPLDGAARVVGHVVVNTAPSATLPLAPWLFVAEIDGVRDVLLFARDTMTAPIFGSHDVLVPIDHGREALAGLHAWIDEVERDHADQALARLSHDQLVDRLVKTARASAAAMLFTEGPEVERSSLDHALGNMPPEGVSFVVLVGPGGVGKSHALRRLVMASQRAVLWVRAVHWNHESLGALMGSAVGMPGTRLGGARLAALVEDPGLLIAIDGLNETREPAALIDVVAQPLRGLARGSVQVVVTSHPEAAAVVLARVEPTWRVGGTGEVVVQPLDDREAAILVGPGYARLGMATRRWSRVPLIALLARAAAGGDGDAQTVDHLIESFVAAQTSDLERALLRALASRMLATGRQALTRSEYGDGSPLAEALREAVEGAAPLGPALAALVDRGLVTAAGDSATRTGVSVAFAHDRFLQWIAGRWLSARAPAGDDHDGWASHFEALAPAPALAGALGQALWGLPDRDRWIPVLATSTSAAQRALARLAMAVGAEASPVRAVALLREAWHRPGRQDLAGHELVALAADLGDPSVIAEALGADRETRGAATYALARVARHSTDTVAAALRERWQRIEPRPWLGLFGTLGVLHAILYARFAEGARPRQPETLNDLAATIVGRMVGTSTGRAARLRRNALLRLAAAAVRWIAVLVPQGPTKHVRELFHLFRTPPPERSWLSPLVDVFRGPRRIDETMDVVRRVAASREVGPSILLERTLIVASRRPAEMDAALAAAVEAGAIGCAANPPTMLGQGALYVLSSHLLRVAPSAPGWDTTLAAFEHGLDRWLEAAPRRRWESASGNWYKSLFVAAHLQLHHRRHGTIRTDRLARMWRDALTRSDEQLAIDLLDDLQILALSRGFGPLALEAAEPLLASSWRLPGRLHREVLELLRAVHERDPDVVEDALRRGNEPVRAMLARQLRLGRASRTAGYAIFLDFDDALVLDEGLRDAIASLFDAMLSERSPTKFLERVLRVAVNRVTGKPVFREATR